MDYINIDSELNDELIELLAEKILPSIRKTGGFVLDNPNDKYILLGKCIYVYTLGDSTNHKFGISDNIKKTSKEFKLSHVVYTKYNKLVKDVLEARFKKEKNPSLGEIVVTIEGLLKLLKAKYKTEENINDLNS